MSLFSEQSTIKSDPNENLPFSRRLRVATKRVHSMAEQTCFIKGFLRGTASVKSYAHLVTDLLEVYRAMEDSLDQLVEAGNATVLPFAMPELYRVPALERDLACLKEVAPVDDFAPSEAAMAYAARLRQVTEEAPHRLVGHLYTRYLGDLSGGQILSRIASRSMGLSRGAGLDFYEFGEAPEVNALKSRFRAGLDSLAEEPEAVRDAIVDEAIVAFRHNIAIFETLAGNPWATLLRNLPFIGHNVA